MLKHFFNKIKILFNIRQYEEPVLHGLERATSARQIVLNCVAYESMVVSWKKYYCMNGYVNLGIMLFLQFSDMLVKHKI